LGLQKRAQSSNPYLGLRLTDAAVTWQSSGAYTTPSDCQVTASNLTFSIFGVLLSIPCKMCPFWDYKKRAQSSNPYLGLRLTDAAVTWQSSGAYTTPSDCQVTASNLMFSIFGVLLSISCEMYPFWDYKKRAQRVATHISSSVQRMPL